MGVIGSANHLSRFDQGASTITRAPKAPSSETSSTSTQLDKIAREQTTAEALATAPSPLSRLQDGRSDPQSANAADTPTVRTVAFDQHEGARWAQNTDKGYVSRFAHNGVGDIFAYRPNEVTQTSDEAEFGIDDVIQYRVDKLEERKTRLEESTDNRAPVPQNPNIPPDSGSTHGRNNYEADVAELEKVNAEIAILEAELESLDSHSDFSDLNDQELSSTVEQINDLPRNQRKELYAEMANSLDAGQLVRVYNELNESQKYDLATAIGSSDTPDTQVEFVELLRSETTDDRVRYGDGIFTQKDPRFDVDARSVAIVIGRMGDDPVHLERAIDSLDDDQLEAVLDASTEQTRVTYKSPGSRSVSSVDISPAVFNNIVAGVARTDNAELKARVFALGTKQIDFVRGKGGSDRDAAAIVDGLTLLIDSDTTGVIGELELEDPYGGALKTYSQEMVKQGNTDKIQEHIAKLSVGNTPEEGQTVQDFLQEETANGQFNNAENLGYYVGSVVVGIDREISDQKERAEALKEIFGTALSSAGKVGNTGFKIATVFAELLTSEAIDAVTEANLEDENALRMVVLELARPDRWDHAAEGAYDIAVGRVIDGES